MGRVPRYSLHRGGLKRRCDMPRTTELTKAWTDEVRRRRAAGLCRDCSVPVTDGRARCPKHRKIEAEKKRAVRHERYILGICLSCRTTAPNNDYLCAKHRDAYDAYHRDYKRKRKTKDL